MPLTSFVYVAATDLGGPINLDKPAIELSRDAIVEANFYAPNGTFRTERNVMFKGAVIARDVELGSDTEIIEVLSFFANALPVAVPQTVGTDGVTPFDITLEAFDPQGDSLTFKVTALPDASDGILTDSEGDLVVIGAALPGVPPQCSDGADNDNDGTVDFGGVNPDLDCSGASDNTEAPIQCDDNLDNDLDGLIDFDGGLLGVGFEDPQCDNASDDLEEDDGRAAFAAPPDDTSSAVVTFTPAVTFDGASLSFTATDPDLNVSNTALVTILLDDDTQGISGSPVANKIFATTIKNNDLAIDLSGAPAEDPGGNENETAVTFSILSLPSPGELADAATPAIPILAIDLPKDLSGTQVIYLADDNFTGSDQFDFKVELDLDPLKFDTSTVFIDVVETLRFFFEAEEGLPLEITLNATGGTTTPPASELSLGPVALDGPAGWTDTSEDMTELRSGHESVAVTLFDGTGAVLVIGGDSLGESVDVYDADNDDFLGTIAMQREHGTGFAATLLQDGRVLVTGGTGSLGPNGQASSRDAEIWDPGTVAGGLGSFSITVDLMIDGRDGHTATLLPDGTVLIAAGRQINFVDVGASDPRLDPCNGFAASVIGDAEIFDPELLGGLGDFVALTATSAALFERIGTLVTTDPLSDPPTQQVLLTGSGRPTGGSAGLNGGLNDVDVTDCTNALPIEVTTVAAHGFSSGEEVTITGVDGNTACNVTETTLTFVSATKFSLDGVDGTTAGAYTDGGSAFTTLSCVAVSAFPPAPGGPGSGAAELYDPVAKTFTVSGVDTPKAFVGHIGQTATLLSTGGVLVAGGAGFSDSAEIYDPVGNTWTCVGGETASVCDPSMSTDRRDHSAALLSNNSVLLTGGGFSAATTTATTEIFDPAAGTLTEDDSMSVARRNEILSNVVDGRGQAAFS